jgi:hypothetical protein
LLTVSAVCLRFVASSSSPHYSLALTKKWSEADGTT